MRKKHIFLFAVILFCMAVAGCTMGEQVKYSQAQRFLNDGSFEKAIAAFHELGEYEDSAKFNLYALAQSQLQDGEFDKAITNFENLGDFKSSALFVRYANAGKLQSAGEYEQAIEAYQSLGDFRDSVQKAADTQWAYGKALEDAGEFLKAIAIYQTLGTTKEAQMKVDVCRQGLYDDAQSSLQKGQYRQAYDAFSALEGYRDSADKAKEAYAKITLFAAKDETSGLWGFMDASLSFVLPPVFDSVDYGIFSSFYNSRMAFESGYEVVRKDGKYGVIDKSGNWVLPNKYEVVRAYPQQNAYAVKTEEGFGLIDIEGNTLIPPAWNVITLLCKKPEYYAVEIGDGLNASYGIVDRQGNQILAPQQYALDYYQDPTNFQAGLVATRKARGSLRSPCGLISFDGSIIISPEWDNVSFPKNGLCVVTKDKLCGLVNTTGEEVLPLLWDDAEILENGLIRVRRDDMYQIVDASGNTFPALAGEDIILLNDTLFAIEQNKVYSIVSRSGQKTGKTAWEGMSRLSDTLFAAKKNGLWGIIDSRENTVLPFEWEYILTLPKKEIGPVLAIASKGHLHQFVDTKGTLIPNQSYDYISGPDEGLYRVLKDGKLGFLDRQLQTVIPFRYDSATTFRDGSSYVSQADLWGCIDMTGQEVTPILLSFDEMVQDDDVYPYSLFYDYVPAYVYAKKQENGFTLANMKDEKLADGVWDRFVFQPNGIRTVKGKKQGLLDYQGNEILEPVYDMLYFISADLLYYERGGIIGIVDLTGKETPFSKCRSLHLIPPLVCGPSDDYTIQYLFDKTGREITFDHLRIRSVGNFYEGLAPINLVDDLADTNYTGYIDTQGKLVLKWKE